MLVVLVPVAIPRISRDPPDARLRWRYRPPSVGQAVDLGWLWLPPDRFTQVTPMASRLVLGRRGSSSTLGVRR
ncbi:MAG TPA: hypothetical protein VHZ03_50305 [Trebonia sp.]|nr:hypothetical protein [Trebonia sp.]